MKECYNIRDYVLDELQFGRTPTTFFLLNGFQLKGVLLHYDDEVLKKYYTNMKLIDSGGKKQLVYQQAVSTIAPSLPLEFPNEY